MMSDECRLDDDENTMKTPEESAVLQGVDILEDGAGGNQPGDGLHGERVALLYLLLGYPIISSP